MKDTRHYTNNHHGMAETQTFFVCCDEGTSVIRLIKTMSTNALTRLVKTVKGMFVLDIKSIHILVQKAGNHGPHPSNEQKHSLATFFRYTLPLV